jgi:Caspase domain
MACHDFGPLGTCFFLGTDIVLVKFPGDFGMPNLTHMLGLIAWLWLAVFAPIHASAEGRHALVIGVDAYENVPSLKKAVNDARAVKSALETAGFEVQLVENPDQISFLEAIAGFSADIGSGDEAIIYYAGHGVEIEGQNYLLPSDVPAAAAGQEIVLTNRSIAVQDLVDALQARGARISLLILDACRDNPFPRSGTRSIGGTRGLAPAPKAEGTFILYSAGEGETALDRLSEGDQNPNSVFTRALVPLIAEPGLPLREVSRRVRSEVRKLALTVDHAQFPAVYDQLDGDFSFTQASASAGAVIADPCAAARADWALVAESKSVKALEGFIAAYPGCPVLHGLAMGQLEALGPPKAATQSSAAAACLAASESAQEIEEIINADTLAAIGVCREALSKTPDSVDLRNALGRVKSVHTAKYVLTLKAEAPPKIYLDMIKDSGLKGKVEAELSRRAAELKAGPCGDAADLWRSTDTANLAAMEAFLVRFPTCGASSEAAQRLISEKKGEAAEKSLRLSRRQIAHIKLVLFAFANSSMPSNLNLDSTMTSSFSLSERNLIEKYAKSRGIAKDGERLRFLNQQIADALLGTDFKPKNAAKAPGSAVQISGQWSSSVTNASCELHAPASDLSDNLVHVVPNFRAFSPLNEKKDWMAWDMISPSPFDHRQPVSANIDGKQFMVDTSDGFIRPELWEGGPARNIALTMAMKRGSDLSFQGTNALTGEPLTVTYSLTGFTAAFQRMASLCNRPALLSWIK